MRSSLPNNVCHFCIIYYLLLWSDYLILWSSFFIPSYSPQREIYLYFHLSFVVGFLSLFEASSATLLPYFHLGGRANCCPSCVCNLHSDQLGIGSNHLLEPIGLSDLCVGPKLCLLHRRNLSFPSRWTTGKLSEFHDLVLKCKTDSQVIFSFYFRPGVTQTHSVG